MAPTPPMDAPWRELSICGLGSDVCTATVCSPPDLFAICVCVLLDVFAKAAQDNPIRGSGGNGPRAPQKPNLNNRSRGPGRDQ